MIKKQIKYALMDIHGNKWFFITQFFLVLATFLLLGFCIWKYTTITETRSAITGLVDARSTYIVWDNYDTDSVIESSSDHPEKTDMLRELYSMMCEQDHYIVGDYATMFDLESQGKYIDDIIADENAMEIFGFGDAAEKLKNAPPSEYIPVMAGCDLAKYFKVGDVLSEEYIIVGFLPKGVYYITPKASLELNYMDTAVLELCDIHENAEAWDYEIAIENMHIVTDDEEALKRIESYASDIPAYSIKLLSISEQVGRAYKGEMETVYYSLIFIVIASVLAVTCMITAMLTFIERHAKEFAIHLMCGATRNALRLRLIIQSGLQYILSYIITAAVCRNRYVTLFLLLICAFFFAVVTIVPSIKLRRDGLNNLLKRSE